MGSTDAGLRLILYLDPPACFEVNVRFEAIYLYLYAVAGCIRANGCSDPGINNPPSCDSRKSSGRRR